MRMALRSRHDAAWHVTMPQQRPCGLARRRPGKIELALGGADGLFLAVDPARGGVTV